MAVIHRDIVKCSVVDVGDYTQFESLAVEVVGRQSSVVVVCIYRPPGEVSLISPTNWLMQLDRQFAVVGDFNVLGPVAGELDRRAADVFVQHGQRQHVNVATYTGGKILDLILTRDDDVSSSLVSQLAVASVCFSITT